MPPFVIAIGIVFLGAYLLSSIPFGLVITRMMGLGDLRQIGSGNIGATNVLRTGSKVAAALTLILDTGKGGCGVLITSMLAADPVLTAVAAVAGVIGHCYPVWLGFRGGKGVATGIGVILALNPVVGLATIGTWLIWAWMYRVSSLAAMAAYGFAPLFMLVAAPRYDMQYVFFIATVVISIISVWRHRDNIYRLMHGGEPRIGE